MDYYNGYSEAERLTKLKAQHIREDQGLGSHPPGPCAICSDPKARLEAHDEDYSLPYLWEPPAQYAVCHRCHSRLHSRFRFPQVWEAHKAHVRRGGVASDDAGFKAVKDAIRNNDLPNLPPPKPTMLTGDEWWERLSTDPRTLTDPEARPRP